MKNRLFRAGLFCTLMFALIFFPFGSQMAEPVLAEGSEWQSQLQQDDDSSSTVVLPPEEALPETGANLSPASQTMPPEQMPPTGVELQTMPPEQMPPTGIQLQTMPPEQMPPTGIKLQTMPPEQMPPTGIELQTMPPEQMPPTGIQLQTMPPEQMPPTGANLAATASPNHLIIPAIDLETSVVTVGWEVATDSTGRAYKSWEVASHAAGWHNTSQPAGVGGNIVISGHHNTLGSVFRDLHKVREGSPIILWQNGVERTYRVDSVMKLLEEGQPAEVRQENARWISETDSEQLTLVTCWPAWSNTHRIVVVAHPVE